MATDYVKKGATESTMPMTTLNAPTLQRELTNQRFHDLRSDTFPASFRRFVSNPYGRLNSINFKEEGYCAIENFASEEEISDMKAACMKLVDEMDPEKQTKSTFSGSDQDQAYDTYFLESGDKIRFFFEKEALDENNKLKVDKHFALNKIGHALHWYVPEFKKFTFSEKVKAIARDFGYEKPAIVQSMYIFKVPNFGDEVIPHKDGTFLRTTPDTCLGFWLALEDATIENGCLWFIPGSHRCPPTQLFVRNTSDDGALLKFIGEPNAEDLSSYKPLEVKKGTLVLLHGHVSHMSRRNTSKKSRNIYTFHIIEQKGSVWSPENWLQPTEKLPFINFYETA